MTAAHARLAALVVAVAVTAVLVLSLVGRSPEALRRAGDGLGAAGPALAVLAIAALNLALFPSPVSAAAAGLLFGPAGGTAVAIAGGVLGATLAFTIARRVAGGTVGELLGPRLLALRRAVDERGFLAVLTATLIPGMPRTAVNYGFGLTRVGLGAFVAASALSWAPRAFAYATLGGSLGDLRRPESAIAIGLLVALGVLGVLLVRRDLARRR